jgi:putative flippase GtrA
VAPTPSVKREGRLPRDWLDRLPAKFVLYVIIGGCAFVVDYSIFLIWLSGSGSPYIANALGIVGGMAVSFLLNRRFNFRKFDVPQHRAVKFVVVALLGMAVSSAVIMVLIGQQVDARIAKVIAMGLVFVAQFGANAIWTFR